ncbi:MAG: DNA polymerase III subunit alpha [Gammaproteobacteria bacterium]|nr:DNA polymerase III subunit alpha [Gammaproteobacteria bacterium]
MNQFVHLRVHTEYSLVDGLVRIKKLMKSVASTGMPAVALSDQSNMFGMVKFYKNALGAGVKPLIGVDLWISHEDEPQQLYRLLLLCQNAQGYKSLTQLVSRTYTEGQQRGYPVLNTSWLNGNTDGLIALSSARMGDIGTALLAGNPHAAEAYLNRWLAWFPQRFYIEVQRTGRDREEEYIALAVPLAAHRGVPVVATNDVVFIDAQDFDAHEARVCIHEGRTLDDPRRIKNYSSQQYLRSPDEMAEVFADLPEALINSVEIAKRCNLEMSLGKNYLPEFPVPEGMNVDSYFRAQAQRGLEERLDVLFDRQKEKFHELRKQYDERLVLEMDVIIKMGFTGYFLIVADFIQWAKQNGIPVGPGRGSGAGSLVAYALTITDLDPIKYDLLFERFLNPERVSMPDFDVDFCMEKRDRVIEYVSHKYGREKVSQIITYGSMAAKAVVRDCGRVLGYPYGFVDQIAKLIPMELGITLEKAIEEPQFKERFEKEEDVRTVVELAMKLEGLTRNAGKHAGGVVIAPSQLTDFTPLYCEAGGGSLVTQLDKDDVESVGLVKFDFLGLRTLTIIDWAIKEINFVLGQRGEPPMDITRIPLDDKRAFDLLKACDTTAVFQLESRGMKDLIKRLQPDCFEDIVALVALFRPGPLQSGMVDDFINRKHGRARVEYPHPALEPILKPTYGVILYQEQVMQIAQVLAGYTLGGADLLRRAMGKKKPEEMAKQREIFTEGALANGVTAATATYIFDLMEKFAGYGFNKSHSAAYALVSYQTAWLKAYFPAAFMAAVLSADMDNTDKVVTLIDECARMKLKLLPPRVNVCEYMFRAKDENTLYYGLGAIKGLGLAAVEAILEERKQGGSFNNLFEFSQRIDLKKLNRRTMETLVRSGALDELGPGRATLMHALSTALQRAEQRMRDQTTGQNDLFGTELPGLALDTESVYEKVEDWPESQRLEGEKETLGLYLSGHPIERYQSELKHIISSRIVDLRPTLNQAVIVAGLIVGLRTMKTKRGDRMAFVTLDDRSGRVELAIFADIYLKYRDLIVDDKLLIVEGEVNVDEYSGGFRMSAKAVFDIDQARQKYAKRLVIALDKKNSALISHLVDTLGPYRNGGCPICVEYASDGAAARLVLGDAWRIKPTDELLHRLQRLQGVQGLRLDYDR